jgi:hypothetical protein
LPRDAGEDRPVGAELEGGVGRMAARHAQRGAAVKL